MRSKTLINSYHIETYDVLYTPYNMQYQSDGPYTAYEKIRFSKTNYWSNLKNIVFDVYR